jgi:hypothetical protein
VRTTVDLDNDVLSVAKHLARERQESLGKVLSGLVRQALQPVSSTNVRPFTIPVLPRKPGAQAVTAQIVKDLLEADV